jgi:Domain of Unknown Function (DUF928)
MKYDFLNWPKTFLLLLGSGLCLSALPVTAADRPQPQPYQVSQGFSWGDLMKILAPPRRSGASRDASVCILSIDQQVNASNPIASLNPTLIWKGNAKAVRLRRQGETTPLWERKILLKTPGIQQIRYGGSPLSPGTAYEWEIDGTLSKTAANFTILTAAARADLSTQLAPLTDDSESTRQQRLTIYSTAGLRSDGLTELWKLKNPSIALQQELTALPEKRCPHNDPVPTP